MAVKTVGFIGLGIMGKPMATRLLAGGFQLVVHNRSRQAVKELVEQGAEEAWSPREVAERAQVYITMLPDSPDVEAVALGPDGLIEGAQPGQVYIDMSTIAPATAIRVAKAMEERGVRCLDAPVSGGDVGAREGTLSIMVGGDPEILELVRPILSLLGRTITYCGPHGAGQTVKACNQIQVAMNLIGMAEALTLGVRAGVDPEIILRVLSGGFAQSRVMDVRGPRVIKGDFTPGFKARLHLKDLGIAMQTAHATQTPLPATALAQELFSALVARGEGELDHSAVIRVLEALAGTRAEEVQE